MTHLLVRQVARDLQLSKRAVLMLVRSGRLPAVNISKGNAPRYRIPAEALQEFLDARKVEADQ